MPAAPSPTETSRGWLRGFGAGDQGRPARCPCPRPGRRLPSRGQLPHVQRIHVSSRFSWLGSCGAGASPPGLPHPLTLCRSQRTLWEVPPSRGAVGTQQEGHRTLRASGRALGWRHSPLPARHSRLVRQSMFYCTGKQEFRQPRYRGWTQLESTGWGT